MADNRDYYLVLGIGEDATPGQVRSAYRSAARAHHPDLHPDDAGAAERFKRVREAYEVLSDPARRAAYHRPAPAPPPAPAGGVSGSYVAAWGIGPDASSERVLSPELLEALLTLRAMVRRAEFERRFRRLIQIVETW